MKKINNHAMVLVAAAGRFMYDKKSSYTQRTSEEIHMSVSYVARFVRSRATVWSPYINLERAARAAKSNGVKFTEKRENFFHGQISHRLDLIVTLTMPGRDAAHVGCDAAAVASESDGVAGGGGSLLE